MRGLDACVAATQRNVIRFNARKFLRGDHHRRTASGCVGSSRDLHAFQRRARHRLVFNPYDSTLYLVTVAEGSDGIDMYVSSAPAIVTLSGVTDLSGANLILA